MKKLFGRKVVGGLSLGWLLVIVSVVAAGAWTLVFMSIMRVQGTTAAGAPAYEYVSAFCVNQSGPGTASCTVDPVNGAQVTLVGVDDTSAPYISAVIRNDSPANMYVCYHAAGSGAAYVQIVPDVLPAIAPGLTGEAAVHTSLVGLTPGTPIDFDIGWDIQATPCS